MVETMSNLGGILNLDFSPEAIKQAKSKLLTILKAQSVFKGDYILSSGKKSDYYLDARLTTLSAEGLTLISYLVWNIMSPLLPQIQGIAGPSIGADPIVSGICQFSFLAGHPLKAGLIRKEQKVHGRGRLVEGPLIKGEKVIILEDVITTGSSSLMAINSVREHGCEINDLICLILREKSGKELIEREANLKVHYIFEAAELLT